MNRREFFRATVAAGVAARAFPQTGPITGKPTNLDEHPEFPGMRMPKLAGEDAATLKYERPPKGVPMAGRPRAAVRPKMIPVSTRAYNNDRTGCNNQEVTLTPANVNNLQLLHSHVLPGDPRLESQPLIQPNVKVSDGATCDLAIYTTMDNNVFAFDAHSPMMLWATRLGNPVTGTRDIDGWLVNINWGILSTGVIDPDAGILYCVAWSSPTGDWRTAVHTFHSINLKDGTPAQPPISFENLSFSSPGLPTVYFKGSERKQRASLAMGTIQGHPTVFVPFGTIRETSNASHGWVVAVDLPSNKATAWCSSPKYSGAGFWMAGAAPIIDPQGDIIPMSGNGSFNNTTDWGENFLKLSYTPPQGDQMPGKLTVKDNYAPFDDSTRAGGPQGGDHITLDVGQGWDDMDLGSSGPIRFAKQGVIVGIGKDGIGYVLDEKNFGATRLADFVQPVGNYKKARFIGWMTFPSQMDKARYGDPGSPVPENFADLNRIYGNKTHHNHSTPVGVESKLKGTLCYVAGENENIRAYSVTANGTMQYLACSAEYASRESPTPPGGMPGMQMTAATNGTATGILVATCPRQDANKVVGPGDFYIYATDRFATFNDGNGSMPLLFTAPIETFNKFLPPIVSGGLIGVPTYSGRVDWYGLA